MIEIKTIVKFHFVSINLTDFLKTTFVLSIYPYKITSDNANHKSLWAII